MAHDQKILIIRTDRIGDVVLTTPAVRSLRKSFPSAHISILVSPITRELVEGSPDIHEVLVDDRESWHKGAMSFWSLVFQLRKKKFGCVINFHTKRRTNLLGFFAGIPQRVGYRNEKYGFFLTHPLKDLRPQGLKHEAEYCLDVVRAIGATQTTLETFVPVQPQAEEWAVKILDAQGLLSNRGPVAIHAGASDETKRWPAPWFAEIIDRMANEYGCSFVLVGGPESRMASDQIQKAVAIEVVNLTGQTTIGQLAAVLKHSRMLISNDSGPVHIADALGTPVVSIFTRNQPGINPERWRPLGPASRVVAPRPQPGISFARGKITDPSYLKEVTVEHVWEAVDAVYKLC